jgi:Na+-transporting NADH:ubiquinone oxidoreductase subunit NqrB
MFQILVLAVLLSAGAYFRDFSIRPAQVVLTFLAASSTQALCALLWSREKLGLPSAVITAISLSLLLRADNLLAHPLAAVAAISAKFLIRFRGKHLFNPANLGVILALLCLRGTWVSPGQWGDDVAAAAWFVALGGVVVHRARRGDVSGAFLGFWGGALALRVLWLGQRSAVWVHQLQSGALLLFAFFMISDPMTIPNHPRGRIAHAALVAAIAYHWQFVLYRPNALLWALFLAAPTVPLWDRLFPATKYEWTAEGGSDEALFPPAAAGRLPARGAAARAA